MELKPIKQEFTVTYGYRCYFTEHLFHNENPLLASTIKPGVNGFNKYILAVIDSGVWESHSGLEDSLKKYCDIHDISLAHVLVIPGGEQCKNDPQYLNKIIKAIDDYGICRHSYVLAVGGGAVLDLAGYAAAVSHRGVKIIRVPTTTLAQNDAGVGVKNGVNRFGKKNFTGTFAVPEAIINDRHFLTTLSDTDWRAGMSEAIKVALLKDERFFNQIEQEAASIRNRDQQAMDKVIYRCAELHMEHIANGGDPFEDGSSRPLDFGHWSAHKLEHLTGYSIRHGEAVAIGLAIDCTYAHLQGWLDSKSLQRILDVLAELGFNLKLESNGKISTDDVLKGIEEFREHLGGRLTITLIEGIGEKKDVHEIDTEIMKKAINHWIS